MPRAPIEIYDVSDLSAFDQLMSRMFVIMCDKPMPA